MSKKHKENKHHDHGERHEHDHHEIMSGELFVVGEDEVSIRLKHFTPKTVLVEFKGHQHHHPCNPHTDELEWEIEKHHDVHVLNIWWNVEGIREIVWAVSF